MFPEVNALAEELEISVTRVSWPAPAVGGFTIPVNVLLSMIDQDTGHSRIAKPEIMDTINQAIGTANLVKTRAFRRMIIPIFWPIDLAALIVRIPFLILRKAGLPPRVEENAFFQLIKCLLTVGLLVLVSYLGLEKHAAEVFKYLGK